MFKVVFDWNTVESPSSSRASLSVTAFPNPITIQPAGKGETTFTESNGVGVHVTSREWFWVLSNGATLQDGEAANDVNVGPRGTVRWVDTPYLSQEVVQRSTQ